MAHLGFFMEDNNQITEEMQHAKDQAGHAILVDPLDARTGEIEVGKTPTVGMKFDSYEEIVSFYDEYARGMGFGTKTRSSGVKNEIFIFLLTCDKDGKPSGNKRRSSKTGCKACIRGQVKIDGRFYLTKVVLEHNHVLTPLEVRKSNKKLSERVKKHLELPLHKSVDAIVARLGDGDAKAIYQLFLCMQSKDPNFFYVMDLANDGQLRNVFWADARSRAAYKYFGDVVSFDTTYLTNRYDVPLVLFVGVNHHGRSVLLGCGLLADETIDTYVWLFKSWLLCMSGQPPKAIITDLCKSIRGALVKVFPEARHRLCLWHIMKKVLEKFGGHDNYFAIQGTFKKAVYGSLRVTEFEDAWRNMIFDFGLENNEWLESLYEIRDRWVPAYLNDTFWAGMCTTQRSEGTNAYFDDYINTKTSLKQFVSQYELALQSKYEKESIADFNSFHKMPQIKTNWQMEIQLSKIYTIDMFNQFQGELLNVLKCHTSPIGVDEGVYYFYVKEFVDIGDCDIMTKVYDVVLKAPTLEVLCNCRSFDTRGILCCHALSALHNRGVFEIPDQYIFPRWRKDFKRLHLLASSKSSTCVIGNNAEERRNDIYKLCHQLAETGAMSKHKYEQAIKIIDETIEKLLLEDSFKS